MRMWKRVLLHLSVFLLVLSAVSFPFRDRIPSWAATLQNNWDDRPFQYASWGSEGDICAARLGEDGTLELRFIDPSSRGSLGKWEVTMPESAQGGEICMLYPVGEQCAYLGVYENGVRSLSVYRVRKGEATVCLMREDCTGDSMTARRSSLVLSSVMQQQENTVFVLLTTDNVRVLSCGPDTGLEVTREAERGGTLSAVSLRGTIYKGEGTETALTVLGNGLVYMDGADLSVHYSDLAAESQVEMLRLEGTMEDRQLTSFSLTDKGTALLLLDGHILRLVKEDGVQDFTGQLFPDRTDCVVRLLGLLVSSLLISIILSWIVMNHRKDLPLAVGWGVVCMALFVAFGVLILNGLLGPAEEKAELKQKNDLIGDVVGLTLANHGMQDEALPDEVCRTLETMGEKDLKSVQAVLVHRNGGHWYLPSGVRAELDPQVHISFLKQAAEEGKAYGKENGRFWYCMTQGENGIIVSVQWDKVLGLTEIRNIAMAGMMGLGAFILLVLVLIGLDVKRTARGLERYAGDQDWVRIRVSGGDEIGGMASTLNSLFHDRREAERERERVAASYRRFVPEQILKLLGKQSILDVDKNTLVSRPMAVMQVFFLFPDPVYTSANKTRLLYDSVNQVIERTASVFRQKGGAVFNFAYNGYDVVMEQDPEQVISAAVAVRQEVLALNEQRSQDALPTVELRIAADVGEVILGIVGDKDQIEPSTMSGCFSTLKELIDIGVRVDANILCTEPIFSGIRGYGSRYMGKCVVERKAVRVYEVFDGDAYETRKGKESGARQFSEGVLSLYSGDVSGAKRIFLELVREVPQDGGARYYLYLADRLKEDDVSDGVSLNERTGFDDE